MTSSAEEQAHPFLAMIWRPSTFREYSSRQCGSCGQTILILTQPRLPVCSALQLSQAHWLAQKESALDIPLSRKNSATGLHHHGEQETVIYVKSGEVKVRWGTQLQQEVLAQAGSFVYIPAFLPHQEINPSPTVS